jgi:hypothetical protein
MLPDIVMPFIETSASRSIPLVQTPPARVIGRARRALGETRISFGDPRRLNAGESLLSAGDPATGLFQVLDGTIMVLRVLP